jgi:hypothetical protein
MSMILSLPSSQADETISLLGCVSNVGRSEPFEKIGRTKQILISYLNASSKTMVSLPPPQQSAKFVGQTTN